MTTTAPTAADLADDIHRVFALQQAHQWEAKASSAEVRKAKLARLKAAVEAHADAIIAAVLEDTRKPVGEIRVTEVLNVTGNIQRNIDNLDAWMAPTEVTPSLNPADRAQIIYEARGVCLVLGPWNFPLGLALGPVAAAIAAGAETGEAMRLAMAAASVVVHQLGTTGTANLEDIRSLVCVH